MPACSLMPDTATAAAIFYPDSELVRDSEADFSTPVCTQQPITYPLASQSSGDFQEDEIPDTPPRIAAGHAASPKVSFGARSLQAVGAFKPARSLGLRRSLVNPRLTSSQNRNLPVSPANITDQNVEAKLVLKNSSSEASGRVTHVMRNASANKSLENVVGSSALSSPDVIPSSMVKCGPISEPTVNETLSAVAAKVCQQTVMATQDFSDYFPPIELIDLATTDFNNQLPPTSQRLVEKNYEIPTKLNNNPRLQALSTHPVMTDENSVDSLDLISDEDDTDAGKILSEGRILCRKLTSSESGDDELDGLPSEQQQSLGILTGFPNVNTIATGILAQDAGLDQSGSTIEITDQSSGEETEDNFTERIINEAPVVVHSSGAAKNLEQEKVENDSRDGRYAAEKGCRGLGEGDAGSDNEDGGFEDKTYQEDELVEKYGVTKVVGNETKELEAEEMEIAEEEEEELEVTKDKEVSEESLDESETEEVQESDGSQEEVDQHGNGSKRSQEVGKRGEEVTSVEAEETPVMLRKEVMEENEDNNNELLDREGSHSKEVEEEVNEVEEVTSDSEGSGGEEVTEVKDKTQREEDGKQDEIAENNIADSSGEGVENDARSGENGDVQEKIDEEKENLEVKTAEEREEICEKTLITAAEDDSDHVAATCRSIVLQRPVCTYERKRDRNHAAAVVETPNTDKTKKLEELRPRIRGPNIGREKLKEDSDEDRNKTETLNLASDRLKAAEQIYAFPASPEPVDLGGSIEKQIRGRKGVLVDLHDKRKAPQVSFKVIKERNTSAREGDQGARDGGRRLKDVEDILDICELSSVSPPEKQSSEERKVQTGKPDQNAAGGKTTRKPCGKTRETEVETSKGPVANESPESIFAALGLPDDCAPQRKEIVHENEDHHSSESDNVQNKCKTSLLTNSKALKLDPTKTRSGLGLVESVINSTPSVRKLRNSKRKSEEVSSGGASNENGNARKKSEIRRQSDPGDVTATAANSSPESVFMALGISQESTPRAPPSVKSTPSSVAMTTTTSSSAASGGSRSTTVMVNQRGRRRKDLTSSPSCGKNPPEVNFTTPKMPVGRRKSVLATSGSAGTKEMLPASDSVAVAPLGKGIVTPCSGTEARGMMVNTPGSGGTTEGGVGRRGMVTPGQLVTPGWGGKRKPSPSPARLSASSPSLKRNVKGETQLHVAAIKVCSSLVINVG